VIETAPHTDEDKNPEKHSAVSPPHSTNVTRRREQGWFGKPHIPPTSNFDHINHMHNTTLRPNYHPEGPDGLRDLA